MASQPWHVEVLSSLDEPWNSQLIGKKQKKLSALIRQMDAVLTGLQAERGV